MQYWLCTHVSLDGRDVRLQPEVLEIHVRKVVEVMCEEGQLRREPPHLERCGPGFGIGREVQVDFETQLTIVGR